MFLIDTTTTEFSGNESAVRMTNKAVRRFNNNDLLVKDRDYSALLKTAAVVMAFGTLVYCAYVVLNVGMRFVG